MPKLSDQLTVDDLEEGTLIRSQRSGSLYRVIYIDRAQVPPVAIVECGGLGAPLLNSPVRYCHPANFTLER